jgi:hypothetical protein
MYGDGIGTLNVYTKFNSRPITENIWNRKGDQDNIWRLGRVTLPKSTQSTTDSLKVLFEGIRGKNDKGKLLIDKKIQFY